MINVTAMVCGFKSLDDDLRRARAGARNPAAERKPVVVWNVTRTCNLACINCYADSYPEPYPGELDTAAALALLADLADFGVRAVCLSGGEPLVRRDTLDLAEYGRSLGLTFTLCTNGTLLDLDTARCIRDIGFGCVEISLDGIGAANDMLRGKRRAFERAVQGIRNCRAVGQKVGLRVTLTPQTTRQLDEIFDFIDKEKIDRACFHHPVPFGRGSSRAGLSHRDIRQALHGIARRTRQLAAGGDRREIFTVGNHADGPFYYLMLLAEGRREAAERAYAALVSDGGGRFSSGVGMCTIDSQGNVHPDRFWQTETLGNVKERKFSEIWTDPDSELLAGLRDRLPRLWGRCAACRYLSLCGGNLRVRAFAETGDLWAPDPACCLSDAQIAKDAEYVLA